MRRSATGAHTSPAYRRKKEHFDRLWGSRWVLCDIGNVLINFRHQNASEALAHAIDRPGLAPDIHQLIFGDDRTPGLSVELDRGNERLGWLLQRLTDRGFGDGVSENDFVGMWNSVFEPQFNTRAVALLASLASSGIKVALCSDTNYVHCEHLRTLDPVIAKLLSSKNRYLSFEMRKTKRDDDFFKRVVLGFASDAEDKLPGSLPGEGTLAPYEEHVFVDDREVNCNAARASKIESLCVTSDTALSELTKVVKERGWL